MFVSTEFQDGKKSIIFTCTKFPGVNIFKSHQSGKTFQAGQIQHATSPGGQERISNVSNASQSQRKMKTGKEKRQAVS